MSDEGSDKRSVHTDALATLGTIIDAEQKRDAIHIAVEPVIAATRLHPGNHVTIREGKAYRTPAGKGLGIVDPFLTAPIEQGQRFWFLMYPRQVRSLRHVWSHPEFPDEGASPKPAGKDKAASEKWLRDFCASNDCPEYEVVMGAIFAGSFDSFGGDEIYLHFSGQDAHGEIPSEFWDHVEMVTGRTFTRAKWFSCSC